MFDSEKDSGGFSGEVKRFGETGNGMPFKCSNRGGTSMKNKAQVLQFIKSQARGVFYDKAKVYITV